ncbi:BTB/POZ protein [Glomus cerebriforme]|uniref:BTB/POZ protein n=1 Tax=Glomus cerebriforme TaxID=658196 RepID=A0A397T584_9GLOM|nr:BTB/POZ protein [Glomus cerebriforme]
MSNEIVNTFIWEIGNFENLLKLIPRGKCITSQRFWLPQKSFDINNQSCKHPTLWELYLFPNGDNGTRDSISLYFHAVQTNYEKSNHIMNRKKSINIGIGKYEICGHYESSPKTLMRSRRTSTTFDIFDFSKNGGLELPNFIPLDSIFPEGDKSKAVNLFVQVTLFEDDVVDDDDERVYEQYFEDDTFTDIEFVLDCGSRIKAHRIVLSANSTYFKNMLQGQWKEKDMKAIQIKETNYIAFRAVVYYIYSGKLLDIKGFDILKNTFKLADMMMLENLSRLVIDELSEWISDENWYEIILLGWEFNNEPLRNMGLQYIADNWAKIKRSEGMLRLLSSNNIEGIEELFYVVNKNMEIAKWDGHSLYFC